MNNVQYNPETPKMQMLLVENLAFTFADDAHALATGFGKVLAKIVTSPATMITARIERIANACDVAGVLADHGAKANVVQFRSRKHTPTSSQRSSSRWCLFPFRSMNHLT
jgi:hypothetical protein